MNTTLDNRTYELCDRCGRQIKGSYIESLGIKICGVCQWEEENKLLKKEL